MSLVGKPPSVHEAWRSFLEFQKCIVDAPDPMPLEEMEPATYSGSANQGTETSSDLVHDLNSLALSIEDDAPECAKQFLESEFLEVAFSDPRALILHHLPSTANRRDFHRSPVSASSSADSAPVRFSHKIRWISKTPTNNYRPFLARARTLAGQLRRQGLFATYDNETKSLLDSGYIRPATVG